jgi:hypothetical protein
VGVPEPPGYVTRNRAAWNTWAPDWAERGRANWAQDEPSWGEWSVPESQLPRRSRFRTFLINGVLAMLTAPDEENAPSTDRLLRRYFGMHRFEWSDDDSVKFHLPHGEMIALLRRSGFAVEELVEIRSPDGSTTRYPYVTLEWSQRWPCEEVWKARVARRVR